MSLADNEIAKLDRQLAKKGQPVTLRRLVANGSPIEAPLQGFVRGYRPEELVGGIMQGDMSVILSPTGLGDWPLPVRIGDKVLIDGALKNIQAPAPVFMGGQLVRINIQARG